MRPLGPLLPPPLAPDLPNLADAEYEIKSEASYDPLFDDEPEEGAGGPSKPTTSVNGIAQGPPPMSAGARGSLATFTRGPTVLDAGAYGTFSADVLLTASIDGSVVLWDRRVHNPGKGVGRLEMSSKTPPWCVSVRSSFSVFVIISSCFALF